MKIKKELAKWLFYLKLLTRESIFYPKFLDIFHQKIGWMEEGDIITGLNNRDRNAFKCVFDDYYKSVCMFVRKYIPDLDQSEDIAQDVFVSIWEKKVQFVNLQTLKSYLYKTARNKALNLLEHEAVKKGYQDKTILTTSTEYFFEKTFVENETQQLMIKMLDKLPPRAREIIYLQLEGFKNNEIAENLKISVYTVKNHKATAYKFLKKKHEGINHFVCCNVYCIDITLQKV